MTGSILRRSAAGFNLGTHYAMARETNRAEVLGLNLEIEAVPEK
jgi:hypothetical protein